jgi:4'-phosphopantetheinyl transferase EntD
MKLDPAIGPMVLLTKLAPTLWSAGGSFAAWLPEPSSVPRADRSSIFTAAKERATTECIRRLLPLARLPEQDVPRSKDGFRLWPDGFVGSITQKGTIVLGILGNAAQHVGLGVDLEYDDGADLSSLAGLAQDD